MRVRAAALVCLLLPAMALGGCGDETPARERADPAPQRTATTTTTASRDAYRAGAVVTAAGDPAPSRRRCRPARDLSCWMVGGAGMCQDGAVPEHVVNAGSPGSIDFSFPVPGWTFQADLSPVTSSVRRPPTSAGAAA